MPITREEWGARQATMPAGARRIHEQFAERHRAAREEVAARAAADDAHWEGFERAVSFLLESEAGDWMHAYRVADPARLALQDLHPSDFAAHCKAWVAVFDTREIGHYPIRVILNHGPAGWSPVACPFVVDRPDGARSFRSLAPAVECAAVFTEIPF